MLNPQTIHPMETTKINEVLEQKLEKVRKVYNFSFVFALAGLVFFLLFHMGKEVNHLFAWLASGTYSIHAIIFFFYSCYQREIHKYQKAQPKHDGYLLFHSLSMILYCIVIFYSVGRFFSGFAAWLLLLVVIVIQCIPMILGTGFAGVLIENLKKNK